MRVCLLLALVSASTASFWWQEERQSPRRQLQQEGFKVPDVKHVISPKEYLTPRQYNAEEATRQFLHHHESQHPRCAVTRGNWCSRFQQQVQVPTRPVPRGSRDCPNACSGWGNCNYDTGLCECPAGHGGHDCSEPTKRPCTNRYRNSSERNDPPMGHIGPDKNDLNPRESGWTASRCYGFCDDDIAMCYCGGDSTFRRIPAPEGSPPWTPPLQYGRPLIIDCKLATDKEGNKLDWGVTPYDEVYGPNGYCNSLDSPKTSCGCGLDGHFLPCDGTARHEAFCINQCSGRGDCHVGFCRCNAGWYGQDCSRKRAGAEIEPGYLDPPALRPWLLSAARMPPAALPQPLAPTRPRPLIYVYDMPPAYTSRMLQYRQGGDACMYRRYGSSNETYVMLSTYSVEIYLHEAMLQSEHRTFDPEEADFFYVPMYVTCYVWPIMGWADYPWWHAPATIRPMHISNMITEAHEWLLQFPWWNRRSGRDHIWLMAHDEGACYMPTHVYNTSIVLTHWGRTELNHTSNTGYDADDYNVMATGLAGWKGGDWQAKMAGHPCYNPEKDLVVPAFKIPDHFLHSPLVGAPPLVRDILLFFRGDLGAGRKSRYSRGIRQKLFHMAHEGNWAERYKIYIGNGETVPGPYSEYLARSKFCLVAPGDGWSPRLEDAVLHGCVPLIVMDGVHAVFESILEFNSFSIRLPEADLARVPELLTAVPPERLLSYQRHLARVWHRFAYTATPALENAVNRTFERNRLEHPSAALDVARNLTSADTPFRPATRFLHEHDAFSTILQWLHSRIDDTR